MFHHVFSDPAALATVCRRHRIRRLSLSGSTLKGTNRQMLLFALIRATEIIGEAASKVSLETRMATPSVP